jgi:8-oxo-dGTP diphosphatase
MTNKKVIQRVVVGGVLINDKFEALILQRQANETTYPNLWELPSGKRDFLEGTEIALVREFKEEAGVSVEIIAPVSVFDYTIEKPDEIRDSTQINFLVKQIDPKQEINISEEHQNYAWVTSELLNNFNLTESTKLVLNKAFEIIKKIQ